MPAEPTLFDEAVQAVGTGAGAGGGFFLLRWMWGAIFGRIDKRAAQLDAEHSALDMSWKDYRLLLERDRAELRARVTSLETQSRAAFLAFQHVSAALIRKDPTDPALLLAERLMAKAYPDDFTTLSAMAGAALDGATPQ